MTDSIHYHNIVAQLKDPKVDSLREYHTALVDKFSKTTYAQTLKFKQKIINGMKEVRNKMAKVQPGGHGYFFINQVKYYNDKPDEAHLEELTKPDEAHLEKLTTLEIKEIQKDSNIISVVRVMCTSAYANNNMIYDKILELLTSSNNLLENNDNQNIIPILVIEIKQNQSFTSTHFYPVTNPDNVYCYVKNSNFINNLVSADSVFVDLGRKPYVAKTVYTNTNTNTNLINDTLINLEEYDELLKPDNTTPSNQTDNTPSIDTFAKLTKIIDKVKYFGNEICGKIVGFLNTITDERQKQKLFTALTSLISQGYENNIINIIDTLLGQKYTKPTTDCTTTSKVVGAGYRGVIQKVAQYTFINNKYMLYDIITIHSSCESDESKFTNYVHTTIIYDMGTNSIGFQIKISRLDQPPFSNGSGIIYFIE